MQILTPPGQACYVYVFRPQKNRNPDKPDQYNITLAFDDPTQLQALEDAIEEVAVAAFGANAPGQLASGQLISPLRHAKSEGNADKLIAGRWYINARSAKKPGVADVDGETALEKTSQFYAGCLARADLWLFSFDRGVSAILSNVQKMGDGERLWADGARRKAFSVFRDA